MTLPSLREAIPGERYEVAYPDEQEPFITLWWDAMAGQWQVLDRDGVPFRGEARRVLLEYIARAYTTGLPPMVLNAIDRALAEGQGLTTRTHLERRSA
jgi:hypothetical protein